MQVPVFFKENDFGMADLILKDGHISVQKFQGYTNRRKKELITDKTNFNLASLSKQFTAIMFILLKRDYPNLLKEPITRYFPELPAKYSTVSIEDLIFHTSGIADYIKLCGGSQPVRNSDVIKFLTSKSELKFSPGSRFEYSNTGYFLLAEILQRMSKVPLPELVRTKIFEPLDMQGSEVLAKENKIENRAIGYGGWPFFPILDSNVCDSVFGDGGVYTSISDYRKWLNALTTPGWLAAGEIIEIFTQGQLNDGSAAPYGFGWYILKNNESTLFMHSGSWTGFRSAVSYHPNARIGIVVFSNSAAISAWDIAKKLSALYIQ